MKLVEAGIISIRDPETGEVVQAVPMYVDADYIPNRISEDQRKQMLRDICRDFRNAVMAMKKTSADGGG